MSKCTRPDMERLLHAYEVGLLGEKENDEFEIHLLSCETCHHEVKTFEIESARLRDDAEAKRVVGDAVKASSSSSGSLLSKVRRYFWPETPLVLRPALAYLLLFLAFFPAYRGIQEWTGEPETVHSIQTLFFFPLRDATEQRFSRMEGEEGALSFQFWGAIAGKTYPVVIESVEAGDGGYRFESMVTFDEFETGSLGIRLSQMKPGRYRLIIGAPSNDPTSGQIYYFRVDN